jgi:HD-like signal output (HDOD) protein
MNEALAKWVSQLQQQPLPALKANCEQLQQLSAGEHTDMGSLATIIESDPGLSVMLLRHINQIRHKHLRSEITTPRHALMMLGLQQLRLLLPTVRLAEELPRESQLRLRNQFSQAFHAAYQARDWGHLRRDLAVDELFTAALLNNLGEMLLNLHAASEVDRVYELMRQKEMEPEEAQYVVFGFSFNQLSLEIARAWHLPNLLCDSMQAENASHNRVLNVMLAAQLARCARHGWYTRAVTKLIDDIAEFMLSDEASIATLIHRNAVEAARASRPYAVPHPAALLLLPATPTEERKPVTPKSNGTPLPSPEEADFCLAPQRGVLVRVLKTLSTPAETLPLKEVLRLVLEGMRDGLGLNRVVFASLTPNKDQLRASFMLGSDNDPGFKRFAVDLSGHNLFVRLMEKPQSLWLDDNNRRKFFPLIPINFHKLIDNDSFFVMSLFVRGKPVGLFYADRHSRHYRLDELSYKRFKQLVTLASHHLGKE